jgi:hypothetical protein
MSDLSEGTSGKGEHLQRGLQVLELGRSGRKESVKYHATGSAVYGSEDSEEGPL